MAQHMALMQSLFLYMLTSSEALISTAIWSVKVCILCYCMCFDENNTGVFQDFMQRPLFVQYTDSSVQMLLITCAN